MSCSDADRIERWRERGARIIDELSGNEAFAGVDGSAPWGQLSLDATEWLMLQTWASAADIPSLLREQYELSIGEGLRRQFGGEWVELDPALLGELNADEPPGIGIQYPAGTIDVVSSLVPMAYRAGTGQWWSTTFASTAKLVASGD